MTTAMQLDLFSGSPARGERAVIVERSPRTEPRRMSMRSIIAYEEHEVEFKGRKRLIVDCLSLRNRPMTDREILNDLFPGRDDMNLVRPRISDLVRDGALIEVGTAIDPASGHEVRQVWMAK